MQQLTFDTCASMIVDHCLRALADRSPGNIDKVELRLYPHEMIGLGAFDLFYGSGSKLHKIEAVDPFDDLNSRGENPLYRSEPEVYDGPQVVDFRHRVGLPPGDGDYRGCVSFQNHETLMSLYHAAHADALYQLRDRLRTNPGQAQTVLLGLSCDPEDGTEQLPELQSAPLYRLPAAQRLRAELDQTSTQAPEDFARTFFTDDRHRASILAQLRNA